MFPKKDGKKGGRKRQGSFNVLRSVSGKRAATANTALREAGHRNRLFDEGEDIAGPSGGQVAAPAPDLANSVRTQRQMDKVAQDLSTEGSINRETLERRKEAGVLSNREAKSLQNHTKYYKWDSPPSSPTKFPPLVPEPGSSGPRTQTIQEQIDRQEFSTLVRRDKILHKIFDDVNGLRVWWAKNRQEWLLQRGALILVENSLAEIEKQLQTLNDPKNFRGFVSKNTEYKPYEKYKEHLGAQAETERKNLQRLNEWMVENRKLMNEVATKFRELREQAERPRMGATFIPGSALEAPQERLIDIQALIDVEHPNAPITEMFWYHEEGITWWLQKSSRYLAANISYLSIKVDDTKSDIEELKNEIEETETKLARLPEDEEFANKTYLDRVATIQAMRNNDIRDGVDAGKIEEWDQDIKQRYEIKQRELRRISDNRETLTASLETLKDEIGLCEYNLGDLQARGLRITAAHDLLNTILALPADTPKLQGDYSKDFWELLYSLVRSQIGREREMKELKQYFGHASLTEEDRRDLLKRMFKHFNAFTAGGGVSREIIDSLGQVRFDKPTSYPFLRTAVEDTITEFTALAELVAGTHELVDRRLKGDEGPSRPPQENKDALEALTGPDPWLIHKNSPEATFELVKNILRENTKPDLHGAKEQVGKLLEQTFSSPDMHPIFRLLNNMPREAFRELFRTHIDFRYPSAVLEAFLVYCNEVKFLFSYADGKVTSIQEGWYPVESPIAGFRRKIRYSAPPGALQFGEYLDEKHFTYDLPDGKYWRIGGFIYKGTVQTMMDEWHERTGQRPEGATAASYIAYFTLTGRWMTDDNTFRGMACHIVTNGWRLHGTEHTSLDDVYLDKFRPIAEQFKQVFTRNGQYHYQNARQKLEPVKTEDALFDLWEDLLLLDGVPMSRYRFRMVLRVCSRDGWWFRLYRHGSLVWMSPYNVNAPSNLYD